MSQNMQSGFWGGTLDVGRREDLVFFWSSPDVWGKLDVGRREDLFFGSLPDVWGKIERRGPGR